MGCFLVVVHCPRPQQYALWSWGRWRQVEVEVEVAESASSTMAW